MPERAADYELRLSIDSEKFRETSMQLLVNLSGISVKVGTTAIFADANLKIHLGDKIAVTGRNGAGKSTFARVIAGLIEPDEGVIHKSGTVSIGYLEQEANADGYDTLGGFAAAGLPVHEAYRVGLASGGLGFHPKTAVANASGGELRKAALARLLATEPDLMILDEPTNHLDIQSVQWLEDHLGEARSAFILISHDRALMKAVSRRTVWLEDGNVQVFGDGYRNFEEKRERVYEEQAGRERKLSSALRREARWQVHGVSGRRKRNQRRLRDLNELRERRKNELTRTGTLAMKFAGSAKSSKLVLEAVGLSKRYGDRWIVQNLNLRLIKGDRLAVVGPNGIGKSTLLNLLAKSVAPGAGKVRHGFQMRIAKLEQDLSSIDQKLTVRQFLAGRGVRGRDRIDHIVAGGRSRHIASYLKDFLFSKWQIDAPVSSLSGGEMARLRFAKIMSSESDLLVLDEPTNDLDIESQVMLQDALTDYDGTVLYASHDRDFIDRTATITVAFEGEGRCVPYVGGWSDRLAQIRSLPPVPALERQKAKRRVKKEGAKIERAGLSFTESFRLKELEGQIAGLVDELDRIGDAMSKKNLADDNPKLFNSMMDECSQRMVLLKKAENEWYELEERNERAKSES